MPRRDDGQALVLFALSIVAILAVASLVFDGANGLVTKRRMQDATDAAAMAGANTFQATGGCAVTGGGTTVNGTVLAAVKQSFVRNFPTAFVDGSGNVVGLTVSCPASVPNSLQVPSGNAVVSVSYAGRAPGFFGTSTNVGATSTALNGGLLRFPLSLLTLDPTGCNSVYFGGNSTTVTFEAKVWVNSTGLGSDAAQGCNSLNSKLAVNANGNPTIGFVDNWTGATTLNSVGAVDPNTAWTPAPNTGVKPLSDPFFSDAPNTYLDQPTAFWTSGSDRPTPDTTSGGPLVAGFPAAGPGQNRCTNSPTSSTVNLASGSYTLTPGWYHCDIPTVFTVSGNSAANATTIALKPGMYVFDNISFSLKANGYLCTIADTSTYTCSGTDADWASGANGCNETNCGALLYFTRTQTTSGTWGGTSPWSTRWLSDCSGNNPSPPLVLGVQAGAGTMRLRPFNPAISRFPSSTARTVDGSFQASDYSGFLIWVDRHMGLSDPNDDSLVGNASAVCVSPLVSLQGGGSASLSGTVYATTADTSQQGNTNGDVTSSLLLQYITYDISFQGNSNFYFRFNSGVLAQLKGYGLIR